MQSPSSASNASSQKRQRSTFLESIYRNSHSASQDASNSSPNTIRHRLKSLCKCGCLKYVTHKTESRHMRIRDSSSSFASRSGSTVSSDVEMGAVTLNDDEVTLNDDESMDSVVHQRNCNTAYVDLLNHTLPPPPEDVIDVDPAVPLEELTDQPFRCPRFTYQSIYKRTTGAIVHPALTTEAIEELAKQAQDHNDILAVKAGIAGSFFTDINTLPAEVILTMCNDESDSVDDFTSPAQPFLLFDHDTAFQPDFTLSMNVEDNTSRSTHFTHDMNADVDISTHFTHDVDAQDDDTGINDHENIHLSGSEELPGPYRSPMGSGGIDYSNENSYQPVSESDNIESEWEGIGSNGVEPHVSYSIEAWDRNLYKETGVLTALDILSGEFRRRGIQLGSTLTEEEMNAVRAFNFKLATNQKQSSYDKIPRAFPSLNDGWQSLDRLSTIMRRISGLKVQYFDCCRNSCMAFTGRYENLDRCMYCGGRRLDKSGTAVKKYQYIPLIPRLSAEFRNVKRVRELAYRSEFELHEGKITDIFDSVQYQTLLSKNVEVDGQVLNHRYFSDPRDIALGFSTDGCSPFKNGSQTCWPFLAVNYNIPPSDRFHTDNVIPLGTVPGPTQMKEIDTFLYPFIEEMVQLARGVKVFDVEAGEYFILRSYLIAAFGDMPAAAKIMKMKGHNALYPCRACNIKAVKAEGSSSNTHYASLFRSDGNLSYQPRSLPLRNHQEFMRQANAVESAQTASEKNELAKKTGIKGIPILSRLGSLSFPRSFPLDFMHLVFENIIPQLWDSWGGVVKGLDCGMESYQLATSILKSVGEVIKASGNTIPAFFGCAPPNLFTERGLYTAEAWSMWSLLLAPILLQRRFRNDKYFQHFLKLINLVNICLKLEVTTSELDELESGFAEWVVEFESIYIQRNMERISLATLPIHSLLHLADYIRQIGPVWCSWAYPMERYCGSLIRVGGSRRNPFKSIDRRERELEQLRMIKTIYGLSNELDLSRPFNPDFIIKLDSAPGVELLKAPTKYLKFTSPLQKLIREYITVTYGLGDDDCRQIVGSNMKCYGKLRWERGATIHAREVVSKVGRDMSYVKYQITEDANSRYCNREIIWQKRTKFGQLQRLLRLEITEESGSMVEVLLAIIRPCKVTIASSYANLLTTVSTDGTFGAIEVVDASDLIEVAARVVDRNRQYFVEQPGSLDFFRNPLHVEQI